MFSHAQGARKPIAATLAAIPLLLCAALAPQPPDAQPADQSPRRPAAAGRTVGSFDFEEQAYNPEQVPRYWFRAQNDPPQRERPGFPAWNKGAFDHSTAHSGSTSVRLPTRGGSTALRLAGSTIPVFPSADYRITAHVRTTDLKHARAFLDATLLDGKGVPVEGAQVRSGPVLSPGTWTEVTIIVPGRFDHAAFLQVELLLLQPERFASASPLGQHAVWPEDLDGVAWFDDVTVMQMPRVWLASRAPANITLSPQRPVFDVEIRDLTGESLNARLTLRDMDGAAVVSESRAIPAGGAAFAWSPTVPRLGWYEAALDLYADNRLVGGSRCSMLWLHGRAAGNAAPAAGNADIAFSLIADQLHPDHYALIAPILARTGLHSATIPLVADTAPTSDRLAAFRACMDSLLEAGASPSVAIVGLGPALAASMQVAPGNPGSLLGRDESTWLPGLQRLFDLYGQRVPRWQIGSASHPDLNDDPLLPARLALFRRTMQRFIPGPRLTLAWTAEMTWPAATASAAMLAGLPGGDKPLGDARHPMTAYDALTLFWPASFAPGAIDQACAQWKSAPNGSVDLLVAVEPAQASVFGRRASVESFMQRCILFWAGLDPAGSPGARAAPSRLGLIDPWTIQQGSRPVLCPEPTLACLATLAEMLGNRRIVGELSTSPGVRCFILAPAPGSTATGALVAWGDGSVAGQSVVGYFGHAALTLVDAFGNRSPLAPTDAAGRFRIPVQPTPVFVENVDTDLVRFLADTRISPNFVPAVAALHEHEVTLVNPWPVNISGQVQLVPPESASRRAWRFSPTTPIPFSIPPGQTVRLPFSFSFSASEEAGARSIAAIISVAADRSYPPMRLAIPITIGLADMEVSASCTLSPRSDGPDVMITVNIANTGAAPRTMQLDMQAPGVASQQQPVSNLGGGESAVRRFVLKGQARALAGKRIRIALFDIDGTERLNKYVTVP